MSSTKQTCTQSLLRTVLSNQKNNLNRRSNHDSPIHKINLSRQLALKFSPTMVLSPVSSLVVDLNSAHLSRSPAVVTPSKQQLAKKRSRLSSAKKSPRARCTSQSPMSVKGSPLLLSSQRKSLTCSLQDSIGDTTCGILSDFTLLPSHDKENGTSLPLTPNMSRRKNLSPINSRQKRSPFKNITNVNRSLCFMSPINKMGTPSKRCRSAAKNIFNDQSPSESNSGSRDSGYSESATKKSDGRIPDSKIVAPRMLDLDTPSGTTQASARPVAGLCATVSTASTVSVESCQFDLADPNLHLSATDEESRRCLVSLLTHSGHYSQADDDFGMDDLYALTEEEDADESPAPNLNALLSFPVKSLLSAKMGSPSTPTSPGSAAKCSKFSPTSPGSAAKCAKFSTLPCKSSTPEMMPFRSISGRNILGKRLASNVDVSPYNPASRPPIRRSLSLFAKTPPILAKMVSPNLAFKRPLPPSDVSPPLVENKRHKAVAVGGTPQFPCKVPCQTTAGPISMLDLSAESSDDDTSLIMCSTSLDVSSSSSKGSPDVVVPNIATPADASPDFGENCNSSGNSHDRTKPFMNQIRKGSLPVLPNFPHVKNDVNNNHKELCRTLSESHVSIMKALNQSHNKEEILTGDFNNTLSLPVIKGGRHPDIQAISSETMADLLTGTYKDTISSFEVLDCRYPYEYEGGHIKSAQSWPTHQQVIDHVEAARNTSEEVSSHGPGRNILVFHCEFSAERGPRAQRLLRKYDRFVNNDKYPSLHYPEIYLLEGGYKCFFEKFPELCTIGGYTRMVDPVFAADLKLCRSHSRNYANESKLSRSKSVHFGKNKSIIRCLRRC